MTKQSPNMKLSRTPGGKPKTALLSFGDLSWNIADGILYGKALDENGDEIIVAIGGKFFEDLKDHGEPADGREVVLGRNETHIQWRYDDQEQYKDLVPLDELRGQDGKEIELSVSETHIVYRYLPEGDWLNLIALDQIKGDDGREIILSSNQTHIIWKYEGEEEFRDLMEKHPTGFSSQPHEPLTGLHVISQIKVSDKGHVTGIVTRELDIPQQDSVTTEDIISAVDVGGISQGDTIEEGTDLTGLVRQLLYKTFFPSLSSPSASLSLSFPSHVEAGYTDNLTISMSFNPGAIMGDVVGGSWDSSVKQNNRAGSVSHYIIEGENNGTSSSRSLGEITVGDQTLSYSGKVHYNQGPQPLDSEGEPYSSPLPSGSISRSSSVRGRRRLFYGHSNSAENSSDIRSLQSSSLNPSNGTSFTINVPQGATNVVIAYRASLRDLSSVVHVEGMNAEIVHQFSQHSIEVAGANGFSPVAYKVFVLTPVEPLSQSATFNCTI